MTGRGLASRVRRVLWEHRSSSGNAFPSLDGLRGVAVLLVLLAHMEFGGLSMLPGVSFVVAGVSGVQLFFVLSSFLLTIPLLSLRRAELASWRTWATYFARRFLRIYPLYTLVLIVGCSVPDWQIALLGPRQVSIVDHLLLRQGAKIMWAIPVEMKFYFLLPVLAAAANECLRYSAWAGLALAAALVMAGAAVEPAAGNSIVLAPSLPYFFAGFAAAVVHHVWRTRTSAERGALEAAAWIAFAWWAATNLRGYKPEWGHSLMQPAARGLGWALVALAAVDARMVFARVLRLAPLRLAGIISFSIYLLHMPVVETVRRLQEWPVPVRIACIVAVVFAIATTTFVAIANPFIEIGRRISRQQAKRR